MNKVQNLLKLKPDLERINLSLLQIESINDLIFELFHFSNLKEIDLSCNRIRSLPKDLSILKTVERLDLSNNLFLDIEAVLFALNTMSNLKELNITYDTNQLKHTLSFYLPRLEVINGMILKSGGEPALKNPVITLTNGKVEITRVKSSKKLLNHGYLFYDEELSNIRKFQQEIHNVLNELHPNRSSQNEELMQNIKSLNSSIRGAYDYNNKIMDKCYDGVYLRNIDTYYPKKQYLKELTNHFQNFLKELNPKIASATKNIIDILFIFNENLVQQAKHLDRNIFRSGNNLSSTSFNNGNEIKEAPKKKFKNQGLGGFSNGERTLLKLKITELEHELKQLKQENKKLYGSLVKKSQDDILEFTRKLNTTKNLKTQNLSKTKRLEKLSFKGYTLRRMNDLIFDIMEHKKAYDDRSLR